MKHFKNLSLIGIIFALPVLAVFSTLFVFEGFTPAPALASNDSYSISLESTLFQTNPCDCSGNTLNCPDFSSQDEAQACYERCQAQVGTDIHKLDGIDNDERVCESLPSDPSFTPAVNPAQIVTTQGTTETAEAVQPEAVPIGGRNLIYNGNFEFGFYQVPELGFEPPDAGNVPHNWNWYRNNAYGKYTIDNNQRFGLVCSDDLEPGGKPEQLEEGNDSPFGPIPGLDNTSTPNSALALIMQSTDEMDARIGVYQTVNVVPGQDYRFSMSSTVEVQAGARTETELGPEGTPIPHAQNNTYEIYFDHTGNTNWRAIPFEKWTNVPIQEETLYFVLDEAIQKGEAALAPVQDYETTVTARSNTMTIFITGWRKWANWRTTIFTIDCVSLVPVDQTGYPNSGIAAAAPAPEPTPYVEVQAASLTEQSTEPQVETGPEQAQLPTTGAPADTTTTSSQTQTQPETAPVQQQAETNPVEAQTEIIAPVDTQPQVESQQPQPVAAPAESQPETAPAEASSSIIPSSGGVLEDTSNVLLFGVAAIVVILGLVGAGIWNIRRSR